MNGIGLAASAIFMIAWLAALGCWFVIMYHIVLFQVRRWQAEPGIRNWLGHLVFRDLRTAWNSAPAAAVPHRRKALRAGAYFIGCAAVAMLAGAIGGLWGGWDTLPHR